MLKPMLKPIFKALTMVMISLSLVTVARAQAAGGCWGRQVIGPPSPLGLGQPVPGAIIRVCSSSATGTPCSPLTPGGIFSDPGLQNPIANPLTADQNGLYNFCASSGSYLVQEFPVTGTTYSQQITVGIAPNGSYTFSGTNTFSGINTFSANNIFSVPQTYTEGSCTGALAGSDILCANSSLHALESSLNNGAFVPIPQLAGDLGGTAASPTVAKIQGTAVTGTTGTGAAVLATSPSLTSPNIGAATGTSLNVSTGPINAGPAIFSGPSPWIDVTSATYGAKCDGATDDTAAFNSAFVAANNGGGVFVPSGKVCVIAGQWVLSTAGTQYNNITVTSEGAAPGYTSARPEILFTGTTTPIINMQSATRIRLEGLSLIANNAALSNAKFIDAQHSALGVDAINLTFRNIQIAGPNTTSVSCLLCLDNADLVKIDRVNFGGAVNAFRLSNTCGTTIQDSYFNSTLGSIPAISGYMITGASTSNCAFTFGPGNFIEEGSFTSSSGIADCTNGCPKPFTFIGNSSGDSVAGYSGTLFKNMGSSFAMIANVFIGGSSNLATLVSVANNADGFTMMSNTFNNFATLIAWGTGNFDVAIAGNSVGAVTAFQTGSPARGLWTDPTNQGGITIASPGVSAPTGVAFVGDWWFDIVANRWKMNNNNGGAQNIAGFLDNLGNFATGGTIQPAQINTGNNPTFFSSAPTIAGAGCGGSGATISIQNGSASFTIGVGSSPGSACTVTMPNANNAWSCSAADVTTISTNVFLQKMTTSSTNSIVITNFNTAGSATAYVASDSIRVICGAQ